MRMDDMHDDSSFRARSPKKRRHESEEPSLSKEEVDIDTVLREFFEDEDNAGRYQATPVRIPSCCYGDNTGATKVSRTSKLVIDDEKPGPSGLQPAVSLAEREVYLYDLHRCDSEDNLTPEERKELLAIQAIGDSQRYSGADIASSSSYQDLTDGQKNIDPPEPEWPKDRPIKPGDILYMMFHRPEKDKEAVIAETIADVKDDKPTLTKSDKEDNNSKEEILAEIKQRAEERIKAYSSIQSLQEDIEKCEDIGSSSSYQDLTDGQKNIDPPEPEWPADRPIKPGDILYMMFHRPEKDKAVKGDKQADEKDEKTSLIKSDKEDNKSKEEIFAEIKQRAEERIKAYSSIQRLHEDIENCSTYVPDARLSNSCFSQVNILNDLPPRSRSEIYITARHRDDAFLDRVITHQSNSSQELAEEFNVTYDRPSGRKTVKRPAKGDINTQATKRPVCAEQHQGIPYERLFNVTEAMKQAQEKMKNGTSTGVYGVGQPSSYSVQSNVKVNEDQKQDHIQTNNQAAPKSFGQSPGIHAHDQTNPIEIQKQAQILLFNNSVCLNDSLGQSSEIFAQSLVDANDVQLQGPSDASNLYRYQPLIPTINMVNPGFCQNGSYNAQPDMPLGTDLIPKMSDMKKPSSPMDLRDSVDKCLAKLNEEYAKKAKRKRKRSIDWKNFNDVTIENDNDFYRYGPKRQRRDSDSNSTVSLDEPVNMDVTPPPPPPFKYPVADAATRRYFEKVIALRDGRPPISSESSTKKKKNTRSRRPSTRRN